MQNGVEEYRKTGYNLGKGQGAAAGLQKGWDRNCTMVGIQGHSGFQERDSAGPALSGGKQQFIIDAVRLRAESYRPLLDAAGG